MAMQHKLSFRKPPDGLLEISDRVYVFRCCFAVDAWSEEQYELCVDGIVGEFRVKDHEASILVCNFGEEEAKSNVANVLSKHGVITTMDYPCGYQGCPVLKLETICHFLKSCERWLSLGKHKVLLMHCERGGWPALAFMSAALLIFQKQYEGEQRTLDMVYRQAPPRFLHSLMPVNPIPSQLRYLHYVSRRNAALGWPPMERAVRFDCLVLKFIPNFDGEGGCRPMFRVYGQDPNVAEKDPRILFATPKRTSGVLAYKQGESEQIKVDINCHIQGDVLIESFNLNGDIKSEQVMFRVMFSTAFVKSNVLILNREKIDVPWDGKDRFPKDFRVEILFSEMDSAVAVLENGFTRFEEKEGLPIEALTKVQDIYSHEDWMNTREDPALNILKTKPALAVINNKMDAQNAQFAKSGTLFHQTDPKMLPEKKNETNCLLPSNLEIRSASSTKKSPDNDFRRKEDKTIKVDPPPSRPSITAMTCQEMPSTPGKTSESENRVKGFKNPSIKLDSSDSSLSVDTCSSGSISPQTPPMHRPLSSKEVHDSPAPMKSHSYGLSPFQPRHPAAEETEYQLKDKSQSFTLNSTTGATSTCTFHNKSPADAASHPSPVPPLKNISPIRTRPDSSPSQPKTPPHPSTPPLKEHIVGPPPSPPTPLPKDETLVRAGHSPSSPPPSSPVGASPPPPPPPPATTMSCQPDYSLQNLHVPSAPNAPPPPTLPFGKGDIKSDNGFARSPLTGHQSSSKGRILSHTTSSKTQSQKLKPLHWLKLSRAVQGSLWAEAQKSGEASKAPEINMSELESLFSAAVPSSGPSKKSKVQSSVGPKSDKVQLIEHTRAYNCEIVLSKVKVPLQDLMSSVLALEDSTLDTDLVENLIKFCPTKEEIEVLKGYNGEHEKLGRCEQFFLELIKVPRVESKLRIFTFKIKFSSQASDLKDSLNVVNAAVEEIRTSDKLKRIMQTILSLGNALNRGTAKGSAIGFRLDSLLKLSETRARNKKITLMHYLCKVLADEIPEVLDFSNDLANLEPASKVQLNFLADEMQTINKGLEKAKHELSGSENDGPISQTFCKNLKEFLCSAEAEVCFLASLYSAVGRNVDALIIYFGEDPSRCPFEQVVTTWLNFTRLFNKAHEENCKQLELERKKAEESEKKICEPKKISPKAFRTDKVNNDN